MPTSKKVVIEVEDPRTLEVLIYGRTLTFYEPNAGTLLDMAELDQTNAGALAKAAFDFLLDALEDDDREWFEKHLRSRQEPISLAMMDQITRVMVEAFVPSRPTTPPSESSPRRRPTTRGSTGPVPSAE